MIEAFCDKVTFLIRDNVEGVDDEKAEIIKFGLYSLISEVVKTSALLLISILFGVFELTVLSIVVFSLLRIKAGGVHANTHVGCFISGILMTFGNIFLAKNIVFSNWVVLIIFIVNLFIIKFYAPADVEAKPIIDKNLRKKLKLESFLVMSLVFFVGLILKNPVISNLLILSTFVECLTLTPFVYKIFGCKYSYGKIN